MQWLSRRPRPPLSRQLAYAPSSARCWAWAPDRLKNAYGERVESPLIHVGALTLASLACMCRRISNAATVGIGVTLGVLVSLTSVGSGALIGLA